MAKKTIAIDGPAGAGKSTVARLVAKRLNYLYIDTGAMYRAITYKVMQQKIPLDDHHALTELAQNTNIKLINRNGRNLVFCDEHDVTEQIRDPEVSRNVSLVSLVPGVRQKMVQLQREMARDGGVVMDGRDICTVVLPDADCKIFLTASVEERAWRRRKEFEVKGYPISWESVKEDIMQRDLLDSQRAVSPLVKSPDAYLIDTTGLTIDTVIKRILNLCLGDD
ncbi:(d)CMP kinase [Candidatus Formimonas warabiya]|uniref:Cytidylate kinase n=1 Tax=Formimonas warabiya TaxID=1761012 RepID=A0A3G1KNQ6_FORW1|nr:(d)CMP kinase [Candidatus Formimonas warabiya]ATW24104.1 cytidylate kinase [Candidatus Formimonas warabiya]